MPTSMLPMFIMFFKYLLRSEKCSFINQWFMIAFYRHIANSKPYLNCQMKSWLLQINTPLYPSLLSVIFSSTRKLSGNTVSSTYGYFAAEGFPTGRPISSSSLGTSSFL